MAPDEAGTRTGWTFVTNHARVLAAIARNPGVRLRDIALESQLTERAVQGIVTDLEQGGYLTRDRVGRRNHYRITAGTRLRHPAEAGLSVEALLDLLAPAHRTDGQGPATEDDTTRPHGPAHQGPGHPGQHAES
ncbi:helix-turn-helix transcriptional regulator [Kitasatospora indigofera]|uniref:helix-turn-helix transcriptional regulator n=1 Tax=Kitasatospora indigofera TaxID=67307 RepID=UPI00324A6DAF